LRPHQERPAIWGELAVKRVVHDVGVDGVDTILGKLLQDALALKVPQQELASITAGHQDLFIDRMGSQHPRVLLQSHAAAASKVINVGSIHTVPNFYSTDLNLTVFGLLCGIPVFLLLLVFELGSQGCNYVSAMDRPLNHVALALLDVL